MKKYFYQLQLPLEHKDKATQSDYQAMKYARLLVCFFKAAPINIFIIEMDKMIMHNVKGATGSNEP